MTNLDGSPAYLGPWTVELDLGSLQLLGRAELFLGPSISLPVQFTSPTLPSGPFVLQDVLLRFLEAVLSTGNMQLVPRLPEQ